MTDINNINNYSNRVNGINNTIQSTTQRLSVDNNFKTLLEKQLNSTDEKLVFSKHAQERVEQRGIELTEDLLNNLDEAVVKARAKGAKDIVIINEKNAFIVNIPNNVVVTTMAGDEMKQNIFTKIDSAVII